MSHFLTLVIGDEPEKQLAKYDENLELPMHLYMTKEQLINEKRKEIEEYKRTTTMYSFRTKMHILPTVTRNMQIISRTNFQSILNGRTNRCMRMP